MHCRDIRKKLSAWSDGEKNQRHSGQIQKHVAHCPECSRVLQDMAGLQALFQQSPLPPLPQGFADSVMKQVLLKAAAVHAAFQPVLSMVAGTYISARMPFTLSFAVLSVFCAGLFLLSLRNIRMKWIV